MGTFSVRIKVSAMNGQGSEEMTALVGTGTMFTIVPGSVLQRIGLIPDDRSVLRNTVNGEQVALGTAQAWVEVQGNRAPTRVIFGDDGEAEARLGSHALTGAFLAIDADEERLVPAVLRMCNHPVRVIEKADGHDAG